MHQQKTCIDASVLMRLHRTHLPKYWALLRWYRALMCMYQAVLQTALENLHRCFGADAHRICKRSQYIRKRDLYNRKRAQYIGKRTLHRRFGADAPTQGSFTDVLGLFRDYIGLFCVQIVALLQTALQALHRRFGADAPT